MFDVGFWELVVIFVIGLLVLGPERLPKVAAQLGQWAGKARRMARVLNTQIQDEINAVDPRRMTDPPPAREFEPVSLWNRPGVDDLKPRGDAPAEAAPAAAPAEPPPPNAAP
jgi:sec-independent protein translocase protein TatB